MKPYEHGRLPGHRLPPNELGLGYAVSDQSAPPDLPGMLDAMANALESPAANFVLRSTNPALDGAWLRKWAQAIRANINLEDVTRA